YLCQLFFYGYLSLLGSTVSLFDDQDARALGQRRRPRGRRTQLRDRGEAALERQVEIDLAARVPAVEAEFPVLGAQDVSVEASVGVPKGVFVQDSRDDQVFEAARIAAARVVVDPDGALDGHGAVERNRLAQLRAHRHL